MEGDPQAGVSGADDAGSVTLEGRYRIVGPGVMSDAVVSYPGETVADGLPVAIAVLRGAAAADAEFVAAVREQAHRLAQPGCVHPALVRVYETGTTDEGEPFVALEPVAGKSLREVLDEHGGLPVRDTLRLAVQIGEALETLHANGIVHGELRPEAVVLLDDEYGRGGVKLVGVELAAARRTPAGLRTRDERVGAYLAPEQIAYADTTEASDVHGFGLLIREMLTGRHPGGAGAADVPPEIRRILSNALAPGPGRRYSSIGLMVNDLWAIEIEPARSLAAAGPAMPAVALRRSSVRRRARSDMGVLTALGVGLVLAGVTVLVGVSVWIAQSDQLTSGGHAVPAEPFVAASPVTPQATALPATSSPAGPLSSGRENGPVESTPPRSREASPTAVAKQPPAVGAVRAPRPAARQTEQPGRADAPSTDGSDGTAIIDWLLKDGRSGD